MVIIMVMVNMASIMAMVSDMATVMDMENNLIPRKSKSYIAVNEFQYRMHR